MTVALPRLAAALQRSWWRQQPDLLSRGLTPLAWAYRGLWALHRASHRLGLRQSVRLEVPVIVVGNLIVGGAGKTPVLMALLRWLQQEGLRPGVVSRGYGRRGDAVLAVGTHSTAEAVGDEPLLIHRQCAVPVWVGRQRAAAAQALRQAHPEVNVIVSDDGLQHLALQRDAELIVFDDRGAGNGCVLPAGPLREPLRPARPATLPWLYNADAPSTAQAGALLLRQLRPLRPLAAWQQGRADEDRSLASLQGRPMLAAAGIGHPERFFAMLRATGLQITALPLPDHHDYKSLPWPAGTPEVIVTEKDAVKLDPALCGATQVWVAGLDLQLPAELLRPLRQLLTRLQNPSASPDAP